MTKEPIDDRRILAAAARLFRKQGFAGTTVRDVARAAGILLGSLHYRYATKESLLLALMERAVAQAEQSVSEAAQSAADPLERVRLGLRAHLRLLLSGDDSAYVLLYDWRSLDGRARRSMIRLRDRYDAFWDALLREAAADGRLRPGVDVKLVRLLGFGAVNWAPQWYTPKGGLSPDEIADAFWAYMGFGVIAPAHQRAEAGA
jgi:TetR/AcrR family transcriptional regulator, cholesterol catabolism regulator